MLNHFNNIAKKIALHFSFIAIIIWLVPSLNYGAHKQTTNYKEVSFISGRFKLVGDIIFPSENGPHPVVIFVHGDGPNNRTSGNTYPPLMDHMKKAGYATFAWDKPGTGKSTGEINRRRLIEQRAQIVLDAIAFLKTHPEIDSTKIGLWGISQAGYVMPRVLSKSDEIAFMIAISCPGMSGADQGAYLISAQAICSGISKSSAVNLKKALSAIERVKTYDEYVEFKSQLDTMSGIEHASIFGYKRGVKPRDKWQKSNLKSEYFWNPIEIIEKTTIPVLAIFGGLDTQINPIQGEQAYREALSKAGNSNFRVEIIPRTDHNIIQSKTGCIKERENRSREMWTNYSPKYLDILEQWLLSLNKKKG